MKVIVDTSVWWLALRGKSPRYHPKLLQFKKLLNDGACICLTGGIVQELLQSVKTDRQRLRLQQHVDQFPLLPADRDAHYKAAMLYWQCAAAGKRVATSNCLIAAVALTHDCALLTDERAFTRLKAVSQLKLL